MEELDKDIQAAMDEYVLGQLDFVLRCDWDSNCYLSADWMGVFSCCNEPWKICDPHKHLAEAEIFAEPFHYACGHVPERMAWLKMKPSDPA